MSENKDFDINAGILEKYNGSDETVIVPEGVTEIETDAFDGWPLMKNIVLPSSFTTMNFSSFHGVKNLENITVDEKNPDYKSVDGVLYFKKIDDLIYVPSGIKDTFILPKKVKSIDDWAFIDHPNIENIKLSENINDVYWYIFQNCHKLKSITVDDNNPYYTSIDGVVYDKEVKSLLCVPCGRQETVVIPESVTVIKEYALEHCRNLKSITIPDSVTTIEIGAFHCCESLSSVTLSKNIAVIEESTFCECKNLKTITIPEGVKVIIENAFTDCTSLQTVFLPESLERIEFEAFCNCPSLTNINLSKDMSINNYAFDKDLDYYKSDVE